MAYCAGVLGVHAEVYKGVVVDVKNVMGISAVVVGMWWWFMLEWSMTVKRRGSGGGTRLRVGPFGVDCGQVCSWRFPAVAVRIGTFPTNLGLLENRTGKRSLAGSMPKYYML